MDVSVICLVYNHEKFLRRCLDGFVNQKHNMEVEFIIHDDKSTDSSTQIIREYEKTYPEIKPIYEEKNLYSQGIDIIGACMSVAKGRYIAFCEGDDYWCDNEKLQLQYDFMEHHSEASMCVHNTRIHDLSGQRADTEFHLNNKICVLQSLEIFTEWLVHFSSYFMRRNVAEIPAFSKKYWFGDFVYLTYAASLGNVFSLPKTMSVYNYKNPEGVTEKKVQERDSDAYGDISLERERLRYLDEYSEYVTHRFDDAISYRRRKCDFSEKARRFVDILNNGDDSIESRHDTIRAYMNDIWWQNDINVLATSDEMTRKHCQKFMLNIKGFYEKTMQGVEKLKARSDYICWIYRVFLGEEDITLLAGALANKNNKLGWGKETLGWSINNKHLWGEEAEPNEIARFFDCCKTDELNTYKSEIISASQQNDEKAFYTKLKEAEKLNCLDKDILYFKTFFYYSMGQYLQALDYIEISQLFYAEDEDLQEIKNSIYESIL